MTCLNDDTFTLIPTTVTTRPGTCTVTRFIDGTVIYIPTTVTTRPGICSMTRVSDDMVPYILTTVRIRPRLTAVLDSLYIVGRRKDISGLRVSACKISLCSWKSKMSEQTFLGSLGKVNGSWPLYESG